MIGVIPAAGDGKRLGMGIKPLVKIGGKRLIEYPLKNFLDLRLKKAVIIEKNKTISNEVGEKYGTLELVYVEQEERRGIAHAISLTEPLVGQERLFIILGDIIYLGNDLEKMKVGFNWYRNSLYCIFGVQKIKDKNEIKKSYGVRMRGYGRPWEVVEKPVDVSDLSDLMGLGIYVASADIFDYIRKTPVSSLRNEVEFTNTLNLLAGDLRTAVFPLNGRYLNINTRTDIVENIL